MKKGDVITYFATLIARVNGLNLSIKRQDRLKKKRFAYFLLGINRLDVKGGKITSLAKNLKASRSSCIYIQPIIPQVRTGQKG